jgi:multisubunit Na+/H+ antiporter MnhB subunit
MPATFNLPSRTPRRQPITISDRGGARLTFIFQVLAFVVIVTCGLNLLALASWHPAQGGGLAYALGCAVGVIVQMLAIGWAVRYLIRHGKPKQSDRGQSTLHVMFVTSIFAVVIVAGLAFLAAQRRKPGRFVSYEHWQNVALDTETGQLCRTDFLVSNPDPRPELSHDAAVLRDLCQHVPPGYVLEPPQEHPKLICPEKPTPEAEFEAWHKWPEKVLPYCTELR